MKKVLFFLSFSLHAAQLTEIYDFQAGQKISLHQALNKIENYDVVVLGENHDNKFHHQTQGKLILESRRNKKSVGFEFIDFEQNSYLQEYVNGKHTDEEFQDLVKWGATPFSYFKPLFFLPYYLGGKSQGINVPSFVTRKISRNSIDSLSDEEKTRYLPPQFELGNDLYKAKFRLAFKDHPMPDKDFLNYFTAQSLWDDMMAYQSQVFLDQHTDHQFFIVVGNFHAEHKLGLSSRLTKRLPNHRILTIVQIDENHYTQEELAALRLPHPEFGALGDLVFFSK